LLYLQSLTAVATKETKVFAVVGYLAVALTPNTPFLSLCLLAEGDEGGFRAAHMQIALPYVSFKKFLKIGNGVLYLIHAVPP
jgi:hypothetical protein